MNSNIRLGEAGEKYACQYLQRNGYEILQANFRCKIGEIDLIARDNDTLVFIEVKTRSGNRYGLPQAAVTRRKKHKLRKTAQLYLLQQGLDLHACLLRFDCIAIVMTAEHREPQYFSHIKNIFL